MNHFYSHVDLVPVLLLMPIIVRVVVVLKDTQHTTQVRWLKSTNGGWVSLCEWALTATISFSAKKNETEWKKSNMSNLKSAKSFASICTALFPYNCHWWWWWQPTTFFSVSLSLSLSGYKSRRRMLSWQRPNLPSTNRQPIKWPTWCLPRDVRCTFLI